MAGSPRVKPLLLRRDTWSEIDSPRTKDGQEMHLSTLLCSQASTGDLAGIKQVLEGCEISQWSILARGDYDKRTPLHLAAAEGHLDVVKFLIEKGVPVNPKDRWEITPLQEALRNQRTDVAAYLKSKGGIIPQAQREQIAVELCAAAQRGDLDSIKKLLDYGADVNATDYEKRTPLHLAASEGRLTVVGYLVELGADVNAIDKAGKTALQYALKYSHTQVANFLKRYGAIAAQNREQQQKALFEAATHGHLDELKAICSVDATLVNSADRDHHSPLHYAASEGRQEIVAYLVEQGADVNARDRWDMCPLSYAMRGNHLEVVALLKSKGAVAKYSPRHTEEATYHMCVAAGAGNLEKLKELISAHPEAVNRGDYDKRTPLHVAASDGHLAVVDYLIAHGADPQKRDRWGSTPLQDAVRNQHVEVARFLSRGAPLVQRQLSLDSTKDLVEQSRQSSATSSSSSSSSSTNQKSLSGSSSSSLSSPPADPMSPVAHHSYFPSWMAERTPSQESLAGEQECCLRFGGNVAHLHRALKCFIMGMCTQNNKQNAMSWDYGELWTPDAESESLMCCQHVHYFHHDDPNQDLFRGASKGLCFEPNIDVVGTCYSTRAAVYHSNVSNVLQSTFIRRPMAKRADLKGCLALPVMANGESDEVLGVIVLLSKHELKADQSEKIVQSMKELLTAATQLLISVVLLRHDQITMSDYATALKNAVDFSPNEHPDLIFTTAIQLGAFQSIFKWAFTLHSEEHKAAIKVLLALSMNAKRLQQENHSGFTRIKSSLLESLKFLLAVSPSPGPRTPVRNLAEQAVKQLVADGVIGASLGSYDVTNASPMMAQIAEADRLILDLFKADSKHSETLRRIPFQFDATAKSKGEFSASMMFGIVGRMDSMSRAAKQEQDRSIAALTTIVNAIMLRGDQILLEDVMTMHRALALDGGAEAGVYRQAVTVGSHMYLAFYRVFLPFEEIPSAMKLLVKGVNSDEMRSAHPVVRAFYAYSVLVYFIHPFEDGNGRTGRLLADMILTRAGLPAILRYTDKVLTFAEFIRKLLDEIPAS